MQAHGDERRPGGEPGCARVRARSRVATHGHAQTIGGPARAGGARPIVARNGAVARSAGDPVRRLEQVVGARLVVHPAQRATAQADQPSRRDREHRSARRTLEEDLVSLACARARGQKRGTGSTSRAHPRRAAFSGARCQGVSTPWIGRNPSARAETANSISPRPCCGRSAAALRIPAPARGPTRPEARLVQERKRRMAVELDVEGGDPYERHVRMGIGRPAGTAKPPRPKPARKFDQQRLRHRALELHPVPGTVGAR